MTLDVELDRIDRATSTLSDAYWSDAQTAARMVEAINEIDRAVVSIRRGSASISACLHCGSPEHIRESARVRLGSDPA